MTAQPAPADLSARIAARLGWHAINAEYHVGLPPGVPLPDTKTILAGEVNMWDLPPWTASRDAAHELLEKLTDEQWKLLWLELHSELEAFTMRDVECFKAILTATPAQLCSAWLRATE